jgi:hypothetical protein
MKPFRYSLTRQHKTKRLHWRKMVGNVGKSWAAEKCVQHGQNIVLPTMPTMPTQFLFATVSAIYGAQTKTRWATWASWATQPIFTTHHHTLSLPAGHTRQPLVGNLWHRVRRAVG